MTIAVVFNDTKYAIHKCDFLEENKIAPLAFRTVFLSNFSTIL